MRLLHRPSRSFISASVLASLGLFLALATARADGAGTPRSLHMVSVGITNAHGQQPLQATRKDAVDMGKWASWQQGRLFRQVALDVLTNEDATRQNILSALRSLDGKVRPGDYTMLYMSAHGGRNHVGEFTFCAYDGGIGWKDIHDALRSLPGTKIVILDTCQAGAIFRSDNLIVFSACLANQSSRDGSGPNGNSVCTKYLLEALYGKADMNQNGVISLAEAAAYVSGKLEIRCAGEPESRQQSCTLWRPVNVPDALPLSRLSTVNSTVTPNPVAPAVVVPVNLNVAGLAGTAWTGSENLGSYGKLTFRFAAGGRATMIDARSTVAGTFTINGNQVHITLPGIASYRGTINGTTFAGHGSDNTRTWSFSVRQRN
jgi:hypothetical protein